MRTRAIATLLTALVVGCGDEDPDRAEPPAPATQRSADAPDAPPDAGTRDADDAPAGPPDAGTRFGHGADDARPRQAETGTIAVPETDRTPPTATIRAAGAVAVSPSSRDDRPRPIDLPSPTFRATAIAVDEDGGTGRIRVSLTYEVRCGSQTERVTENHPPAQIERVRLAPGTEAPVRRVRTKTLRLRAEPGCTAEGDVFAEATNAHGLDAVSRHIRFVYDRSR